MSKEISRRDFVKTGLASAAIAGATGLGAAKAFGQSKAKFKWRMQTHWPSGTWYYKNVYVAYCDKVRRATNGEVDITPYPPNTLVPTKDVFEAVGRGVFELALLWPAYWIGRVPVAGHVNGYLFTWNNLEEMMLFFFEMGAMDIFREAYAEHGLYLIGPIACSGIALFSNRALRKPEDWKGFKVRSTGTAAAVFEKMGATPVYFPGAELYQALQTGVCEGAHWGAVFNGWEMKLHEVNKYIILPFLARVTNGEIFVNQKLWKTLPSDVKQVLESCTVDVSVKMQSNVYGDYLKIDEFQKKGFGEVVTMDERSVELLTKYSMEVIDEYSKKDPKYCGRVGVLMKEFFRIRARI